MPLSELDVIPVLQEIVGREIEAKKLDHGHHIFLAEKVLIDKLNPQSDEDIRTIRVCASTYVDTMNEVSDPMYKIDTDIDEYEMARAESYRKEDLEGTLLPKSKSGCLTIALLAVLLILITFVVL